MPAVNTNVTVGTTSTTVLSATTPSSGARSNVIISNISNEDVFIAFGAAAELNKGTYLKASGGTITLSSMESSGLIQLQINAICTTGSKLITVTYA